MNDIPTTISAGAMFLVTVGGPALVFICAVIAMDALVSWLRGTRRGGKK